MMRVKPQIPKPANAYQAYQIARYHFQQLSPADLIKSRSLLEEAISFDADFAVAHAALAEQSVMEGMLGLRAPIEIFPKAKDALRRAAELNPHSTEFYTAAGFVDLICDFNFAQAEVNLRKALELNPHNALANNYLGQTFMFRCQPEDAEFYLRRAVEIEPMTFSSGVILAIAYFLGRDYQKAIEECEKMLAVHPHFFNALWMRCCCWEQTGRAAEALVEYEKILREPNGELVRRWMGYTYALVGDTKNALATAARVETEKQQAYFVSPTHLAALYAALKDTDKAISYLEDALEKRDPWMLWIGTDPHYDNLRGDSRFDELLRRVGLKDETVAKKDYRFVAEVEKINVSQTLDSGDANEQIAETPPDFSPPIKRRKSFAVFALVALLVGAVGFGYYFVSIEKKSSSSADGKKSIAVLPFVNVSQDTNAEYLSDGITENVINNLSQLSGLKVMAKNSVFRYKSKEIEPKKVADELGVQTLVTGDIKQVGDKIFINIHLIDPNDDSQIWGKQFVKNSSDVFAAQTEIAQSIAQNLTIKFNRRGKTATRKTPDGKRRSLSALSQRSLFRSIKTPPTR